VRRFVRPSLTIVLAATGLALGGCGTTNAGDSSSPGASQATPGGPATPGAWTGLGAKLADWETAHPQDLARCEAGTCFGDTVGSDGSTTDQFTLLTTTEAPSYRVDGYEQALPDGTSLASAKAAVRALLPSDTVPVSFRVAYGSTGSCAFWNLRSSRLGRWFSGRKIGDSQGELGILLDTATTSSASAYDPANINNAIVSIGLAANDVGC
jgi:hypothetical protein